MAMYAYKGQGYCLFLIYDSSLKLFTPIFSDATGLAKFKMDVADPWKISDVNVPLEVSAHVAYHDAVDLLIKAIDPSYFGRSLDLGHGHISVAGQSSETIMNIVATFSIFPKKPKLISKDTYKALMTDIQRDSAPSDDGSGSSTGS
ncbi:hypothetical protein [Pseudomonas sp. FP1742]|uniref:hypothetical protein n=1 Tax=Pseudomonas sp. FP1742 TaxID=2954079 RepID=UPI0027361684|nr:hypothetical protein [Pseudomonas sp. FP1742]WLG49084.1 hypothetical protein PSH64_20410 [Pseudomonas sp. FP1742]